MRLTTKGQSTVEYMLVISVIVIALCFAAQAFVTPLKEGLNAMSVDTTSMVDEGYVGGS